MSEHELISALTRELADAYIATVARLDGRPETWLPRLISRVRQDAPAFVSSAREAGCSPMPAHPRVIAALDHDDTKEGQA